MITYIDVTLKVEHADETSDEGLAAAVEAVLPGTTLLEGRPVANTTGEGSPVVQEGVALIEDVTMVYVKGPVE